MNTNAISESVFPRLQHLFSQKDINLCHIELIELHNKPLSFSMKLVIYSDKDFFSYAKKKLEITSAHSHPYKNYYYCYCDFDLIFYGTTHTIQEQILVTVICNVLNPLHQSIEEFNFDNEVNKLLTL